VEEIGRVARAHGLWMHVDAAYGGGAAIVPEFRHVLRGCELADSIVVNPHKWMFTPIDLSAFYTRRPEVLRQAFSLVPEYLRTSEDGRAVNLMDYGVPLGRRFRALKLWFVMRAFGRDGAAALVREHIQMARELESWIAADERFELSAPVPLSLVCFRKKGGDEENRKLVERVNATGKAFLSHTALGGRYVIRFAIGNMRTTRDDVRQAWDLIRRFAAGS
jgi:aromatic-L-amino-acid decarboxylase